MRRLSAVRPADDRHIVGDGADGLPAKAHRDRVRLTADAPRISEGRPVVGGFGLSAVNKVLFEQAVVVADAVAVYRQGQRSGTVQKAGRQTAETAVSERGVLDFLKDRRPDARLFERPLRIAQKAEAAEIVVNGSADQKTRRVERCCCRQAFQCGRMSCITAALSAP